MQVGQRGGGQGDVGFDSMSQSIDTGGGSQARVNRGQQIRIDKGNVGNKRAGDERHLQSALGMDNAGELGDFSAGTGGSRDDDHRRQRLVNLVDAFVIGQVSAIGGQHRSDLGHVGATAAANSDDGIAVGDSVAFQGYFNFSILGVGAQG